MPSLKIFDYFLKFLSMYMENTLIGEKSIKTKHMLVTKADHENIFRSFISVLDGFEEARKTFYATVSLNVDYTITG
jgi:hypothetical protein